MRANAYRYYVTWILFAVYTLNYLDRQILAILIQPIKTEFQFSDMQLGLLGGLAFALFYTALGIPIARWADRGNRVTIITLSMVIWSVFTAVTGRATSFVQLFFCRVAVGIGEAGCNPAAYSIIGDYFEPSRRATALSIYSLGVYGGQFLGLVVGGYVAQEYGWRTAFYVVGLPGILLAIVVKLTVRDPPRGQTEPGYVHVEQPPLKQTFNRLWNKRSFRHLSFASGLHAMVAYGVSAFYSAFLMRSHGMSLAQTGLWLGIISAIGGLTGTYLGGKLSDVFMQRTGDVRYQMWVPGIALLINAPCWIAVLLMPDKVSALALMLPSIALGATYLAPSIAATQRLVQVRERALGSALLLFVLNLIGIGLGPMLTGLLSDLLNEYFLEQGVEKAKAMADGLRYALGVLVCVNIWSAWHYLRAARTLREDLALAPG